MRTLLKVAVILGVVILALGLVVSIWPVPNTQAFASIPVFDFPYFFLGLVLVMGGAIIAWLGYTDQGRKES